MIWAIYVSDKPHSRINFPIGMNNGVWGVHDTKKDSISKVKVGDIVSFVYSISWLKAEGKPPRGFSRVSKENVHNFRGVVQQLITGKVTRSYYSSEAEVWPDDKYPHRFDFEIIERHEGGVYFGDEFFHNDFVEAVRYSACTQGSITPVSNIEQLTEIKVVEDNEEVSEEHSGHEGKPIWRLHKSRERDSKLVRKKKEEALKNAGKLECEVCQMDFEKTYGAIGYGFAECHHVNPLAFRNENEETKLKELAILCANCHRMIHRQKPWMSISELRKVYNEQNN